MKIMPPIFLTLLLGLACSIKVQRSNLMVNNLAELQSDITTDQLNGVLTCQTAINNSKGWRGLNATSITSLPTQWTDSNFTPSYNALFWANFTNDTYTIKTTASNLSWDSAFRTTWLKTPRKILSTDNNWADDIARGMNYDSYFLSSLSSLSETRLKNTILTKSLNQAGAFAAQIYVKGIPQIVVIDDQLPFYGTPQQLRFAQQASDGSLWGPLLEKVFAKVMGNYEQLNNKLVYKNGSAGEAWDFTSGIPSTWYANTDPSAINSIGLNAYNIIASALGKGYVIAGYVASSNSVGLPTDQHYTILGAYEIKSSNGTITNRLFRIRNPDGKDVYTGNWRDSDTIRWTPLIKNQVPYVNSTDDADVFIEDKDFVLAFTGFWVGHFNDTYVNNYLEVLNDNGTTQTFNFTTTQVGNKFVGIQFYNPRMYPITKCHNSTSTYANVTLYSSDSIYLNSQVMFDYNDFSFFHYEQLAAGSFKMTVQAQWGDNDVKDYTVRIYGDQIVNITGGTANQTSKYNYVITPNATSSSSNQSKGHTCQTTVNNFKEWRGLDLTSIITNQTTPWTDSYFPHNNDALFWSDFTLGTQQIQNWANDTQWARAFSTNRLNTPNLLAPQGNIMSDIIKGDLADGWFFDVLSIMGMRNFIITQTINQAGIYPTQVYVKGIPQIVVIDDYLPFHGVNGSLLFAQQPPNGRLWGPLLEKTFAKVMGNYEVLNDGSVGEALDFLMGAPALWSYNGNIPDFNLDPYNLSPTQQQNLNVIGDALAEGYPIYAKGQNGCMGRSNIDAVVLGTSNYLIEIQFIEDSQDILWVGYGIYFHCYSGVWVNYYNGGYVNNYLEVLDDAGITSNFTITTNQTGTNYIGIQFYNSRMYPLTGGCRGQTKALIIISTSGGAMLDRKWVFASNNYFDFIKYDQLAAGSYILTAQVYWSDNDVKDFTVRVYGSQIAQIRDLYGGIGKYNYVSSSTPTQSSTSSSDKQTCQATINNFKEWRGINATNIINQITPWNDTYFTPTNDTLFWFNNTKDSSAIKTSASALSWGRAFSTPWMSHQAILSVDNNIADDIIQGQVADSYFLAALSSLSGTRLKYSILTQSSNQAAAFAAQVYVKGIPQSVVIDDYLPFYSTPQQLRFAKQSSDGSLWGPLMEKAFAKVMGNYERLFDKTVVNNGSPGEAWDFISGIPSTQYSNNDPSTVNLLGVNAYNIIANALSKGYVVACLVANNNTKGLSIDTHYTILSAHNITNSAGGVTLLFRIRNPTGKDLSTFTGYWKDNSANWTASVQIQVPSYVIGDDGDLFIEVSEFVNAFSDFWVGYFNDNYVNNYLEVANDAGAGTIQTFTFTTNQVGTNYIGIQFYNPRMYPLIGCHTITSAVVTLYTSDGILLNRQYMADYNSFNFFYYQQLDAGSYKMTVQAEWNNNDVKDYTVRIYGDQVVPITGGTANGTSKYNYVVTPNITSSANAASSSSQFTCKTAINNSKRWRGIDATSITSSPTRWTDPNFTTSNFSPTNNALFWPGFTLDTNQIMSNSPNIYWERAFSISWLNTPRTILSANNDWADDTVQGYISDNWLLAALSSLSETRMKNIILTQSLNNAGAFATQVYVKGIPQTVVIDDLLPFETSWDPYYQWYWIWLNFAKQASDGSLWGPLMEKTFAKVMGNYEALNYGGAGEAWAFTLGCPYNYFINSDPSSVNNVGQNAYNIIANALSKGYVVAGDVGYSNPLGLLIGQTYTILGAYSIKDFKGYVTNRLLHIRNPWGIDVYSGRWSDSDPLWTDLVKKQVPTYLNADDGDIFIEDIDFVMAFYGFWIGSCNDPYINNYLEVLNDLEKQQTFYFTTTKVGVNFIGINFYNPRMYQLTGCRGDTKALVTLYTSNGTQLASNWMFPQNDFSFFYYEQLAAGSYKMTVQALWGGNDVRDYTVRIYGDQIVHIVSALTGDTSKYNQLITPNITNSSSVVSTTQTCQTAIINSKSWRSLNSTAITSLTTPWTDTYFSVANASSINDALFWSNYTLDRYSIKTTASERYWARAFSTNWLQTPRTILSADNNWADDIVQSGLGDSYFLAALSSLSATRLKNAILTQTVNQAGAIALQVYVKGIPQTVVIDDYLPFTGLNGQLYFAQQARDGSLWGALMEKTYAKVMGNYEQINDRSVLNSGSPGSAWDFISGIPSTWFDNSDVSTINHLGVNAFNVLADAFTKGYVASGVVYNSNNVGLPSGQAYTILGAHQLKDSNGFNTTKLIHIRNPSGIELVTGNWQDNSPNWTPLYIGQVPYVNNITDGDIFVDADYFVTYFQGFWIGYFVDNYYNNYLEVLNDDGQAKRYGFNLAHSGTIYVGIQFYDPKMYPSTSCRGETKAFFIFSDNLWSLYPSIYYSNWVYASDGFAFIKYENLASHGYDIQVQVYWGDNDVKDYTVRVYGDQIVNIGGFSGGLGTYNKVIR